MTIYATPFAADTMEPTGSSVETDLVGLGAVTEALGGDWVYKTKRMVIYQADESRVAFTDWLLHIDEPDTNG